VCICVCLYVSDLDITIDLDLLGLVPITFLDMYITFLESHHHS
jgi:hypothetical protein